MKRWDESEIEYIKDNWGSIPVEEMATKLNRTIPSIFCKAGAIGVNSLTAGVEGAKRSWTDTEIDFLRDNWKKLSPDNIARELGRTKAGIILKASKIGLIAETNGGKTEKKKWTTSEIEYLKSNWGYIEVSKIAEELGRTKVSIMNYVKKIGLKGCKTVDLQLKPWTSEEIKYLSENWGITDVNVILSTLKRTGDVVMDKVLSLNLDLRKKGNSSVSPEEFNVHAGDKSKRTWTDREIIYLKNQWTSSTADDIAKKLGRSKNSVVSKATKIGLITEIKGCKVVKKKWETQELEYIKSNWGHIETSEMAEALGRSESSIIHSARRLGLNMHKVEDFELKHWTKQEESYLVDNWGIENFQSILQHLNRSEVAVMKKVRKLNLDPRKKGNDSNFYRWTEEEESYLETKWGTISVSSIAKTLKRTEIAIYEKAKKLGLSNQTAEGNEYLRIKDICEVLGVSEEQVRYWIKLKFITARKFTIKKRYVYQITIKDFCGFLEEHQGLWNTENANLDIIKTYFFNFRITEDDKFLMKSSIPKWLQEKIENDKLSDKADRFWTVKEEKFAVELYRQNKTYSEIATRLGRTITAVKSKVLKIKNDVV